MPFQSNELVSANFNYKFEQKYLFGKWDINGTSIELLNHPDDVFLGNNNVIISDSGNSRIVVLNRLNWQLSQIIYPYINEGKNMIRNVTSIYQTIQDNNGNFYSIVDNMSLIKYHSNGQVISQTYLPILEHFD